MLLPRVFTAYLIIIVGGCSLQLCKALVIPGLRPGYDLPATEMFWNRGQIVERTYDWSQMSRVIARAKSIAARSYIMFIINPVTPGLRPDYDVAAT